jgi:hypothetical protein
MPMIIPDGFAHVVHHFQFGTSTEECSFGYGVDHGGFPAPTAPEDIADELHGLLHLNVTDALFTPTRMNIGDKLLRTSVSMGGSPPAVGEKVLTVTGTSGTQAVAAAHWSAITVQKVTGKGGRKYRGRICVPAVGMSEDMFNTNGVMPDAVVTDQQSRWTAFFTALNGLALPMVLLHSDPAIAPTPITSLKVKPQVGLQRRRVF